MAKSRFATLLPAGLIAALIAAGWPVEGAAMQGGGDTRDLSHTPLVVFEGPVRVRPGEDGQVAFAVTNRYNQSIEGVRIRLAFQVGGSWLEARRIAENATDAPRFTAAFPLPFSIPANATHTVALPFATTSATQSGVYLASMTLDFQYVNATGFLVDAHFASFGSLDASERDLVNLDNSTQTLDALALDGIVPDTSITVDGGDAMRMWLAAAGFGVAVIALGIAYGAVAKRRRAKGRR